MVGLGTVINVAAIVLGGLLGSLFGKLLKETHRDALGKICGVAVLFIGITGALEGMLTVEEGVVSSRGAMLLVISLAIGGLLGEILNIEGGFERFGAWLKVKTGNAKDKRFIDGFVTASLTVCIGAMAIVGALKDGLEGDISVLAVKAVLDFVIVLALTGTLGKGCGFSAIPVALLQGGVTALAGLVRPIMTEAALANLSTVGNVLIFCVGINLVWGKTLRVANLLPAVVIAAALAFLPVAL